MPHLLISFFLLLSLQGWGQSDSTIVLKKSENYIEIKSLRHVLAREWSDTSSVKETPNDRSWCLVSYIPKGPIIKDGIVVIRDRTNRILRMYIYQDSIQIQREEYRDNVLQTQITSSKCGKYSIEKYFDKSGNLINLRYYIDGKYVEIKYTKEGEIEEFKVGKNIIK